MPTHISYGGIESIALNLWKSLKNKGYSIDFVCHGTEQGVFEKKILDMGTKIYHIPIKSQNYRGTIREFSHIVKNGQYDVVHAHMNATCGIYLKVAKRYGVPVLVAHSHASSIFAVTINPVKILINFFEKARTNLYANLRIACSQKAGKWLFGKSSFKIVINSIETGKFLFSQETRIRKRDELNIENNEFVICHIGGFLKCKNHKKLLDILKEIKIIRKDVCLILIGDGPLKEDIVKQIKKLGLENSVRLLGKRNDIFELLQASDVFLLPSFSEGNPVTLMEAATSGLHCLVSDTVSRDSSCYFQKGSIEFLPIRGRDSSKLWAERALSPWDRVHYSDENIKKLDVSTMAEKVEQLYREIIKEKTI